jgi:U4/U6 small nuclear ribonucleoprotein PRP31
MATIADELLNDFGDSGDENEEQVDEQDFGGQDANISQQDGGMVLEDDEEAPDEDDQDGINVPSHIKMEEDETEEETKARVEKMELQKVNDVRSVAGLMKQLEPLLQVSASLDAHFYEPLSLNQQNTALTKPAFCRKLNTTGHSLLEKRRKMSATSKIIQSTSC